MRHYVDPDRRAIIELWEAVDELFVRYEELSSNVHTYKRRTSRELARLRREIAALQDSESAVAIEFSIGGSMPGQITVDTTNETATVSFVDDKGNPTSAPDGAQITFASSDESVATVAADDANPLQADITPVGLGSADISASSNGTAMEADGVTPIPDPDPVTVTVAAGTAAGEEFTLSA